jgi:threonine dehydrogenase-like Zn-dependent dehydrogenase
MHLALVEPLAVGFHAVSIAPVAHPIPSDTSLLVLGGGPIGLSVIQAILAQATSSGDPPLIIVSEPSKARQNFALEFGAQHVVDPLKQDLVAEVRKLTEGRGCDVVLDAAGVQSGLDEAMQCLRAGGTVVNIAVWEKRATLEMNQLTFRERAYIGCATYNNQDFGHVLQAMAKDRIRPGSMITRMIDIEDIEDKGFRALIEEKDTQVKIMVDMAKSRRKDSAIVVPGDGGAEVTAQ